MRLISELLTKTSQSSDPSLKLISSSESNGRRKLVKILTWQLISRKKNTKVAIVSNNLILNQGLKKKNKKVDIVSNNLLLNQ